MLCRNVSRWTAVCCATLLSLAGSSCSAPALTGKDEPVSELKQHIHVEDINLHIWDCSGLREGRFALRAVEGTSKSKSARGRIRLKFANGVLIESDGKHVSINQRPLPPRTLNVTVRGDGYEIGTFVRTFR